MTAYWNVPYVGQVGTGANLHGNDCGPACVAMVIGYFGLKVPTVDSLFDEVVPNGDTYTSYGDLTKLLYLRGIDVDYAGGVMTKDLYWSLAGGVPVIVLVTYGFLDTIRPNNFKGAHFMLAIGMDLDTIYMHDPLNTPTSGANIAIPIRMFETAWENLYRSVLVPNKQLISIPPVLKVVTPRDSNGIWVHVSPDALASTRLYAVPYGTARMSVYAIQGDWGKISATREQWVSLPYTKEVTI